mmetsp:Transcript_28674/g.63097  ORF Transcript_28674/g.63097 Transcript_28674/m.63097 type:complete len:215 (+) Transcript_28674:466-1110(+)
MPPCWEQPWTHRTRWRPQYCCATPSFWHWQPGTRSHHGAPQPKPQTMPQALACPRLRGRRRTHRRRSLSATPLSLMRCSEFLRRRCPLQRSRQLSRWCSWTSTPTTQATLTFPSQLTLATRTPTPLWKPGQTMMATISLALRSRMQRATCSRACMARTCTPGTTVTSQASWPPMTPTTSSTSTSGSLSSRVMARATSPSRLTPHPRLAGPSPGP